eukprot:Gb_39135 [translate_table: standard]
MTGNHWLRSCLYSVMNGKHDLTVPMPSGNDFMVSEPVNPLKTAILSIAKSKESKLLALIHAAHILKTPVQNPIDKPPLPNLFNLGLHKPILLYNRIPQITLILHLLGHGKSLPIIAADLNSHLLCDNPPQLLPSENIPIGYIKRLVLPIGFNGRPYLLLSNKVCIRCIHKPFPCHPIPWISELHALLLAEGSVDCQRAQEIHQTIGGKAKYHSRPMDRPTDIHIFFP